MKRILLLVLVTILTLPLFADAISDNVDSNKIKYFNFTLIPYSGGVGVNLGSMNYGPHKSDVGWSQWEGTGETNEFYIDPDGEFYSPKYSNAHIVALGGAYNIPLNGKGTFVSWDGSTPIPSDAHIEPSGIRLEVNAFCDTDFEFVSQSNPIYRRPFQIEILPRMKTSGDAGDKEGDYDGPYTETVHTLDSDSKRILIDLPAKSVSAVNLNDNYLLMIAADMVLVLPYDYSKPDGGYFSGGLSFGDADGLTYKNATYTLANLNDYTAVVTLQLTLTIEYKDSKESNEVKTYTDTRSLTIPFSGYYSSIGDGSKKGDSISLFVQSTENAANLNLERQGEWITVGNIQFLYNSKALNNTQNEDIVRIFLSSSPFPDVQGSEFRMVHEDATNILTNTNSLGFDARIVGTGSNSGDISLKRAGANEVSFDGMAYTGNTGVNGSYDSVKTVHNQGMLNNNTTNSYRHFHTFEGDIDIRFDSSGMMDAGIYRGYIYVHAVTEDET